METLIHRKETYTQILDTYYYVVTHRTAQNQFNELFHNERRLTMIRKDLIQAVKKLHESLMKNTITQPELKLIDDILKWHERHTQKGVLEAALEWWDYKAKHLVYDETPKWIRDARQLLDDSKVKPSKWNPLDPSFEDK